MPVGRRSNVCAWACLRSSRRTVSPAPPSKRTLSGTTIAARPCCFRMVRTCWRKLSCLLLVLAQKSSRCTTSDCFSSSPASLTIVTLLFFPNGGLVRTISYSPCFAQKRILYQRLAHMHRRHQSHAAKGSLHIVALLRPPVPRPGVALHS